MSIFRSSVLAAIAGALLAGCASSSDYSDAEYRVAEEEALNNLSCRGDTTPVCVSRGGRKQKCYCEDKAQMEHMLDDPYIYDEKR